MTNTLALIAGLVLLVVALFAGVYGRRQHRRQSLVTGTPTTELRQLSEEGLIELKGTVTAEETFESPIGGEECVASVWEIEEWDERGDSEMWETRASGVTAAPFALDDGTDDVRVDVGDHVRGEYDGRIEVSLPGVDVDRLLATGVSVDDVYCAFERFPVELSVPPDGDPPERIERFVAGNADVPGQRDSITNVVDLGTKHGERRYYEQTITPGQEIYLLGEASAVADATHPLGPDDVVVEPHSGEDPMIISDQSEEELASELGRYRWAYAAAGVLGLAGIALVAYGGFVA